MKKKGLLIVISGPSGVGKSTIRERLIEENQNFWYSISMTTRKPRINEKTKELEIDGKDYFFVTKEEFERNIASNNFFEYAEVYENMYYGTPKDKVFEMLNKGYDVILEIDVKGALEIKKQYNEALLIFIKPNSIEELKNRLMKRNTDSNNDINKRIKKAEEEISYAHNYDYIVTSKTKEKDYQTVLNIIKENKK